MTRGAHVVGAGAEPEGTLGGDQQLIAPSCDGFAEDLFGPPVGVDIRAVEHVQAMLEADVDQPRGLGHATLAPRLKELVGTAERTRAEGEHRDLETRTTELS